MDKRKSRTMLKRQRSYIDPEYEGVRDLVTDRGGNLLPHLDPVKWPHGRVVTYFVPRRRWWHRLCCIHLSEDDD